MKNSAIVVIDVTKELHGPDVYYYKHLENDMHNLGKVILSQCLWTRYHVENVDLYIDTRGLDQMSEFVNQPFTTIKNFEELVKKDYDNVFLCGVHLGRCVNTKTQDLINTYNEKGKSLPNIGILMNLTLPFPTVTAQDKTQWSVIDSYDKAHDGSILNMYYYAYGNLIPLRLKNNWR